MSKYKAQGSKDSNHDSIIKYFRDLHCSVGDTHGQGGFIDCVVANHRGETIIVEIKTADGKFTCSQLEFLAYWRGYSAFVTNTVEAYSVVENPKKYCLSNIERHKLLTLCTQRRNDSPANDPEITVAVVKKVLGRVGDK